MPRQIREILASVRETGDRGRNTGAAGKYGRSGNPNLLYTCMPTHADYDRALLILELIMFNTVFCIRLKYMRTVKYIKIK